MCPFETKSRPSGTNTMPIAASTIKFCTSENPASKTESYIALKVQVSNWRWQGVPFYLRTGKRLRARASAKAACTTGAFASSRLAL